jgi:hypothetical protein
LSSTINTVFVTAEATEDCLHGRGAVSDRNCDAERSMWVCRFSRCGSIPPLLHNTICERRALIARPDQLMNTHPPA